MGSGVKNEILGHFASDIFLFFKSHSLFEVKKYFFQKYGMWVLKTWSFGCWLQRKNPFSISIILTGENAQYVLKFSHLTQKAIFGQFWGIFSG